MKNTFKVAVIISVMLVYVGCKKAELQTDNYSQVPVLPATPYNYDNSWNDNEATLGRVLFYDKKMSLNNSVSCGSCHQQSKAFCDNKQFSTGLQDLPTRRNTPSIIRHSGGLFWDSRASNYHDLALMPLVNHVEMYNYDVTKLESKIASVSYYPDLFQKAYGNSEVTIDKIQSAIAEFLNNIDFSNNNAPNPWATSSSLTALEEAGRTLFTGKAKCSNCHAGQALSGWFGNEECIGLDETYADNGLGERTGNAADNAKFRVPPLFNIEYTAPYMHDGRFKTLEEVIEHYNSGIKAHPNLSWALQDFPQFAGMTDLQIQMQLDTNHDGEITDDEVPPGSPVKMNLTDYEKKALVAFLKALSDPRIYTDVRVSDPFRVVH